MKNVIAMYRDLPVAERVVSELIDAGVPRDRISIVSHHASERYRDLSTVSDRQRSENAAKGATGGAVGGAVVGALVSIGLAALPGIGWILAAGPVGSILATGGIGAAVGAAGGGLGGALNKAGIPQEHAQRYAEGIRRGGAMIAVETKDDLSRKVTTLLERHDPIDIDKSAKRWREEGWTGTESKHFSDEQVSREREKWRHESAGRPVAFDATRGERLPPEQTARTGAERTQPAEGERRIPIVEEEVDVSKRDRESGGVRVRSRTVEEPVEEDLRLRQERVDIERRDVNRPATPADRERGFREEGFDVVEHTEEPVVRKEARVTGEVGVRKETEQRTEHISEVARHTEVDVQRLSPEDLRRHEPAFREHFRTHLAGSGGRYEDYGPAYELGAGAGMRSRPGQRFEDVEPQLRSRWERDHRDVPFARVRNACAFGFEECGPPVRA